MIEIGTVPSEYTNLTIRDISAVGTAKKSDGANVAEASMSFGDVIDMINPLQHIPVVSSIYRAIAGEDINPVSRIAGDALYGGVIGVASAGIAAIGAIGDEIVAANNGGQSLTGTLVAALSGGPANQKIQLASKEGATPENTRPEASFVAAPDSTDKTSTENQMAGTEASKAPQYLAMPKSKLPFGGVMDTATLATAQENQNLALALAGQRDALHAQRALRNSRFEAPVPPTTEPPSPASTASANPTANENPTPATSPMGPEAQTAMQALLQELVAMKAIKNYQNAAEMAPFAPNDLVNSIN